MKNLPIYIVEVTDDAEMFVNSLVSEPAHRHYFITQAKKELRFSTNEDKREVLGVVLAANQPIYYYSETLPECYIVFTRDSIRKLAEKYFAQGKFNLIDVEHDFNTSDRKTVMLETYFAKAENEFNVDEGSWIVRYKIYDDELWGKIKAGEIKGYSIAGLFELTEIKLNQKPIKSSAMEILNRIKQLIMQAEHAEPNLQTIDGKPLRVDGELKEGSKLYAIAEDGTEILAPQGEYLVKVDEKVFIVVVNEVGVITSVVEKPMDEPTDQQQVQNKQVEQLQNSLKEIEQKVAELSEAMMIIASEVKNIKKFKMPEKKENANDKPFKIRVH